MQLKNYAAWIPVENAQLEVGLAPFPRCGDDELVIKNHVVAINPVDWKIQASGGFNLTYPAILGSDVAGEVLSVGKKLKKKFAVGDRVISHALGLGNGPAYGGFQFYPILSAATTSLIPDDVPFKEAAVLPLSISTAAAGLFMNANLGLNFPKADSNLGRPFTNTKDTSTLLLWGGSSSVGSSVIQFAAAAGYAVIATASPANYEYCKTLGATYILDYHNPDIIPILISVLKGTNVAGAYDSIGSDTTVRQCASVLHALGGGKIASVVSSPEDLYGDVTVARIGSTGIVSQEPEVAKMIWGRYVPWALKNKKFVPSPKALIAGKGLDDIQKGLDRQKQGVSASKVEILLDDE
ncbi:zinc-binding oxidoreductase CipB [Rhizodiscina lignyota]|uniref:Zinc-binding oxidoreductase CipB n=1 Tax=Rhizodiscina lignyota TaxID=1504668 RepID=A0A9P4M2R5_9PEZI|nr:zinc-binding oxidoreductase CipB [Rhizodiscina lignyota]